jgi:hypothetical protein
MAGTPGHNQSDDEGSADLDLAPDAIHESGGTLTIKNPELSRLIHSKLAEAMKTSGGKEVAARPRIRIRVRVNVSK